jgi:hypothetical protein
MAIYLYLASLIGAVAGCIVIYSFSKHFRIGPGPFLLLFGLIMGYIARSGFYALHTGTVGFVASASLAILIGITSYHVRGINLDTSAKRAIKLAILTLAIFIPISLVTLNSYVPIYATIACCLFIASHSASRGRTGLLQLVRIEAGLLAPAMILAAILLGTITVTDPGSLFGMAIIGLGTGLVIGLAGAAAQKRTRNSAWVLFGALLGSFFLSIMIGGSGAVAAAVTGFILGMVHRRRHAHEERLLFSMNRLAGAPAFFAAGYLGAPLSAVWAAAVLAAIYLFARWVAVRYCFTGKHSLKEMISAAMSTPPDALAAGALAAALISNGFGFLVTTLLILQAIALLVDIFASRTWQFE